MNLKRLRRRLCWKVFHIFSSWATYTDTVGGAQVSVFYEDGVGDDDAGDDDNGVDEGGGNGYDDDDDD